MDQQPQYDHSYAMLAAAQLVEQLRNLNTSDLEIEIKDSGGQWLVTVKLHKKN
jgi:hypothetical protein